MSEATLLKICRSKRFDFTLQNNSFSALNDSEDKAILFLYISILLPAEATNYSTVKQIYPLSFLFNIIIRLLFAKYTHNSLVFST